MLQRKYSLLALLFVLTNSVFAAKPRLEYTVDLTKPETHRVHVTLKPVDFGKAKMAFQMPVWAPGAYSVTHYGRYVENFVARDAKGNLPAKRINDDRWEIANANKLTSIEYDILDSHADTTSLFFGMAAIDTNLFFANTTALYGYVNDNKSTSSHVTYITPQTWQLVTALDPIGQRDTGYHQRNFQAKDYDELVDAPVMAAPEIQSRRFTEGLADYDIAVISDKKFVMDSLLVYTQKIVRAETDFFQDVPFKHYTFLIYAPTFKHAPSMAQGALEHANSSDYLLTNAPWYYFRNFGLRVLSHEFFHLWNVKRIHSSLLGPFDYTQRVKTTSLWLSEGVTDYYANTILSRYGIIPRKTFYTDAASWLASLNNSAPSVKEKTLEQLSIDESDFKMEEAMAFYTRGPLIAMLLDIEIRTRTNNQKSLDDVMWALNQEAKKGMTFKDPALIHKFEKITGLDLSDFYSKYIAGHENIPVETYLNKIGLTTKAEVEPGSGSVHIDEPGFTPIREIPHATPDQVALRNAMLFEQPHR